MTILGLRMAQYCNGVSELHGERGPPHVAAPVAGPAEDEIPIRHVTNGVHVPPGSRRTTPCSTTATSAPTGASIPLERI
jgi:glucan phosphorylase